MSDRNNKGQFIKGRKESNEDKVKRIRSLSSSWEHRADYIKDVMHPKIYNCWRSFMFTLKGKKIGCSEEWKDYRTFYSDVIGTYKDGLVLTRINKAEPFSKDNFIWLDRDVAGNTRDNAILLTYKGETKTLKEWALLFKVTLAGIRLRYHRHKDLSAEEIIFGKKRKKKRGYTSAADLAYKKVRIKASKMCSAYKFKDKRKRYKYDLTVDWLIENILYKKCIYCGTDQYVGCDRIDNDAGHTKDNVVPCCIICNTVRGHFFAHDEMFILGRQIAQIMGSRKVEN